MTGWKSSRMAALQFLRKVWMAYLSEGVIRFSLQM